MEDGARSPPTIDEGELVDERKKVEELLKKASKKILELKKITGWALLEDAEEDSQRRVERKRGEE